MPKSRFFRVAVEGATSDGRQIDGKWIKEMAETYNPETYAARVNLEHVRGITAEPPFQALGDVLSVKAEEVVIDLAGKQETKLALFAEIEALEPLVAMNKKGQKLFTSIEVNPSFADTGKAYLVGLAVTDSPASLGTEMLQFAASQGDKNPLASRKQAPGNLFTAAAEIDLELVDDVAAADAAAAADPTGVFSSIKAFFDRLSPPALSVVEPAQLDAPPAASDPEPAVVALATLVGQLAATTQGFIQAQTKAHADLSADLAALKSALEEKPSGNHAARPPATGGDPAKIKTSF